MIKNAEIEKLILSLKVKYRKDADALEEIARAEQTIVYYEKKNEHEKAEQHAKGLEDFLKSWY